MTDKELMQIKESQYKALAGLIHEHIATLAKTTPAEQDNELSEIIGMIRAGFELSILDQSDIRFILQDMEKIDASYPAKLETMYQSFKS